MSSIEPVQKNINKNDTTSRRMGVLLHLALRLLTMGFLFFCPRQVSKFSRLSRQMKDNKLFVFSLVAAMTTSPSTLNISRTRLEWRLPSKICLYCMYNELVFCVVIVWSQLLLKALNGMDEIYQLSAKCMFIRLLKKWYFVHWKRCFTFESLFCIIWIKDLVKMLSR